MNLIVIGIFALNSNGSTGAIFQMVNHGLVSLAAFLVIGLIELRAGKRRLSLAGRPGQRPPAVLDGAPDRRHVHAGGARLERVRVASSTS